MSTTVAQAVPVRLETACLNQACADLAFRLHHKLNTTNYTRGVSLMPVPDSLGEWQDDHRTARKRAWRAERLGYRFAAVDMSQHSDEIHEINTSKDQRQGRPMSAGYLDKRAHGPLPTYDCDRHRINTYGVLQGDVLRAYLTLYRVGELALVSMILGHGDHLKDDVMYLLFAGLVADQAGQGGWFYYNRHDSGQDGLRFYKERVGFRATEVEWLA